MKKMMCVLVLLVGIVSIVSADYHSKEYGIVINMEVTSVHDDETTIKITDKTIEIMGNSVADGRIVLNIIQRIETNGQVGFIVERNGVGYSVILLPGEAFMWNCTGKELDEEAIVYYLKY